MIQINEFSIPYLNNYYHWNYLKRSRLFIRWDSQMKVVIYKFDEKFEYIEYKIPLKNVNIFAHNVQFVDNIQNTFVLGIGIQHNEFVIFVLGLQRQELVSLKRISTNNVSKFDWPVNGLQSQAYQLQNNNFKVIDFSRFTELQEYIYATHIESFDILYFKGCQLLKLKKRLVPQKFYLLPICKTSKAVKFNENLRNSIFLRDRTYHTNQQWIYVIIKITQIYFYDGKKLTVGYFFSKHHIETKYLFTQNFGTLYDGRYWIKVFQIRSRTKVIRKLRNVTSLVEFRVTHILCFTHDNTIIVYDFTTGSHFICNKPKKQDTEMFNFNRSFLIVEDLQQPKLCYVTEKKCGYYNNYYNW